MDSQKKEENSPTWVNKLGSHTEKISTWTTSGNYTNKDLKPSTSGDLSDSLLKSIVCNINEINPTSTDEEVTFYRIETPNNELEDRLASIPDQIKNDIFQNFPIISDGPYTIPKQIQLETYIHLAKCFYSDYTTNATPCHILFTELWIVVVPIENLNENPNQLKGYVCIPVSRVTEIKKEAHKASEISWKFCFRNEHHFILVCNELTTGTNVDLMLKAMNKFTNHLKSMLNNLPLLSFTYARLFKKCEIILEKDPNSENEQEFISYDAFDNNDELEFFNDTIYSLENSLNKEFYKILTTLAPDFESNNSLELPKEFSEYVKNRKKNNNLSVTNNDNNEIPVKIIANLDKVAEKFKLTVTSYPNMLVIPKGLSDDELRKCFLFREKGRLPALTYVHTEDGKCQASLWRSSQCKSGVTSSRCMEDEKFISQIFGITNSANGIIYDARPYVNAMFNKFNGKGYHNEVNYKQTNVKFLDIPNIHAVKSAYKNLVDQIYESKVVTADASSWTQIMQKVLLGSISITNSQSEGTFVIINCSDGWDRTPQLVCLSKIILDPYYRTFKGFKVLIEIDWVSYGHQFQSRLKNNGHDCPIFVQFLDCVRILYEQNQQCFEFNDLFLAELASAYFDSRFDFFIRDSITIFDKKQKSSGLSIWNWVNKQHEIYENPFYEREINYKKKKLVVDTHQYQLTVWTEVHRADLKFCLRYSEYDKRINDKKMQNRIIISKIKGDNEYKHLLGLADSYNFVKL